jgi:hypothetical protein
MFNSSTNVALAGNYYIEESVFKSLIMNIKGESTLKKLKNILRVDSP